MKRTHPASALLTAALIVTALLAVALPGAAQAQQITDLGSAPLATATVYDNGVDFLPEVSYRGAKVTVSGRELVYERSFGAHEGLSIDMFDPYGQLLPDGTYKWRLALTPTKAEARALRRAARRDDRATLDRWQAQSGVFTIKDGRMVDPSLVEARPVRREGANLSGALPADLAAPAAAARIGDDTDDAVASGYSDITDRAAASATTGNGPRSDAATLAAGPAPTRQAVIDEQPTSRRSSPTDGKNGRN